MKSVDCQCDAGAASNGICPRCYGWGWYWEMNQTDLQDLIGLAVALHAGTN